ncbi:hypothetical protein FM042_10365 [Aliidiomarina halalkaliphila]|uniref:Uncharacterized protein n=1 Tax=Aliidiomarina halalkaliphila TaxID=2593535 RepID=A0A552WZE5_9GAMM|nr:hypothetical protein [Aliidiomarina halalkaliphila]TRW48055.1 hypothetical protein FM042_10365 [Aliidiomarina halalkaliphila]
MVTIDSNDSFSLRVVRDLGDYPEHKLDICLFVPGELGLTSDIVTERAFYHQVFHVSRTYHSQIQLEPLVRSRLIQRIARQQERQSPEYRLSLSLYAYQYVTAMEQEISGFLRERPENLREDLAELLELSATILRRLRRTAPKDEGLRRYYTNIDNYLSWFSEQQFLRLAAEMEFKDDEQDMRELMLRIARRESKYRDELRYNSERVNQDSTRMSNKMRLLRRLIEYPVTLRRIGQELGKVEERLVKAGVAAVLMTAVSLMILSARDVLFDVTAVFILLVALLYAAREVFRDEVRQKLWLWLRRGRAKWRHQFVDPNTEQTVGKSQEWIDYKRIPDLPEEIQKARKAGAPQRGEIVLHYSSWSKMLTSRFLSGYATTRETIVLDLEVLAPLLEQTSYLIYRQEGNEVTKETVEKRSVLNIVIRERWGDREDIQRWKVVLNRNGIVETEADT